MKAISSKFLLCSCLCLLFANVQSADLAKAPLPDPLSLDYSLSLSDKNNVFLSISENELTASQIKSDLMRANLGVSVKLKTRARWVESPEVLRSLGREDHAAKIIVSKPLYDFGRTSNKLHAGVKGEEISSMQLKLSKQTHRLKIMRAFFDVLLADLMYARDNEAMAMGYIYYDRVKEYESVGQNSELDILEKDSFYQATRQARYESESRQRSTRHYLSLLLDRPGKLPSRLEMPALKYQKHQIIDVNALYEAALENNISLLIMKTRLAALLDEVKSIRAQRLPIVSAELEAGIYERNIGSNDVWRAGVQVEVPIYQGGQVSAKTALKKNEMNRLKFEIYQKEQDLKQEILEHWLSLSDLKVQSLASETLYDYREYYLDRARALYEMDVKSDLGDSMVELSAASLKVANAQFETAMRWERLAQLTQMTIAQMSVEELTK